MANINKRTIPGNVVQDPSAIDVLTYSDQVGAWKVSENGRSLLPLGNGSGGYTTDASTARILPGAGQNLAIYNSDTSAHAVTVSGSGSTIALGPGEANASGNVGIACPPGTYTYVACYQSNWVVTDNAALYVYLINDSTTIIPVAPTLQNNYGFPGTQP
jgi:hypothetical protein